MLATIALFVTIMTIPADGGDAPASFETLYEAPTAMAARPPRSRYSLTLALDPPRPARPLPSVAGPAGRPLVVIDAGHGGHDPGARSDSGVREKDVTLQMALAVRAELLRGGRVRVAMTRDADVFLILQERAEIARALRADLFVSVHADATPADGAAGATIYTLSEVASDARAQQLALRENKADIINGVNLSGRGDAVSSILIDLAQRETMNASARFAGLLRREGTAIPFRRDFHHMAGFAVLKAPDTPAALFEVGYLTNADDLKRITSEAGRAAVASGVRRAVEIYFARRMANR